MARVIDGPAEPAAYTRIGFSTRLEAEDGPRGSAPGRTFPAVTLALAKKKGTNAVAVAAAVQERMAGLARTVLPDGVRYEIVRDYGATARRRWTPLSPCFRILTVLALWP